MSKDVLDCDSFLLGIVYVGDKSFSAQVLKSVGAWEPLYRRIESLGALPCYGQTFLQTEEAKRAIEAAQTVALELDHHFIDIDHLMLGLLDRTPLLQEAIGEKADGMHQIRRGIFRHLGIDVSTDADYKRRNDHIRDLLSKDDGDRTDCGDRKTVRAIYDYLQGEIPPQA